MLGALVRRRPGRWHRLAGEMLLADDFEARLSGVLSLTACPCDAVRFSSRNSARALRRHVTAIAAASLSWLFGT
jgi:hypothetical protein